MLGGVVMLGGGDMDGVAGVSYGLILHGVEFTLAPLTYVVKGN